MAVYLYNDKGDSYSNNRIGWSYVYLTAMLAGWQPSTEAEVTEEESHALADALEKVLAHTPTQPRIKVFADSNEMLAAMDKLTQDQMSEAEKAILRGAIFNDWNLDEQYREHLTHLIGFCRQGAFHIT